jgi:nucleotide-diphospho-sugar transferase
MTKDGTQPTEAKSVIALFCTLGMEAFLSNAIEGILRVGIDADQICVGCPENSLKSVKSVARLHSTQIRVIPTQKLSDSELETEQYDRFGSRSFTEITWKKIFFIRQLIEVHAHVIYADLDVSWIRNPLPYLTQVAEIYPVAFQTEGLPRFPPALCFGFASFARSERAIALLDALIALHSDQIDDDNRLDDQAACQYLIENDVTWLRCIYWLPEVLFLNGLGYRNLQQAGEHPCPMEGELQPFLFHANWTIGTDNKRRLLTSTGTWLLDHRLTDTALEDQGPAPTLPVLTVIYPVFDVRGDIVERVRLWTEGQDFDPRAYRILVVAGAATKLNDVALRKVLRNQDAILRVPGVGRDADYWNAGAREAKTQWLLFVEAHGLPERDSLATLAAWIAANPNGEACNFKIRSLGGHHITGLMQRWFAEVHKVWADTSTWRRLHRTAFAIRRDIFEDVGPFEPEYGQFAPPLLAARMDRRGLIISALPRSSILHDDSPEISDHHHDTADYARGEMEARHVSDPGFFEAYFGPAPFQGSDMILSARHARSMARGLLAAALHRPGEAFHLLRQACSLLPRMLLSLRGRARLLAALTRADEYVVMHLPVPEPVRWRQFLLAHRRLIRAEQMLWMMRNPLPSLPIGPEHRKWPIAAISRYAIIGLHVLEQLNGDVFRWTHPVFLLKLAISNEGVLTLETRNVRSGIALSDIVVVIGPRILSPNDLALDDAGNLKLRIQALSTPAGETEIVVIVRELCEPRAKSGHGRRLGLPVFSVHFRCDNLEE